jgi:MFS family permease
MLFLQSFSLWSRLVDGSLVLPTQAAMLYAEMRGLIWRSGQGRYYEYSDYFQTAAVAAALRQNDFPPHQTSVLHGIHHTGHCQQPGSPALHCFQTRYDISYEMLGRLALLNFATQLTTDFVAIQVVDRTGYRGPLVLAHALCTLGLVLLAVLPHVLPSPYLGLSLAIVVYAIGGGLLEVLVSPVVEALPTPQEGKAAAMSLLHSFYCWGQVGVVLGTTLLLGADRTRCVVGSAVCLGGCSLSQSDCFSSSATAANGAR